MTLACDYFQHRIMCKTADTHYSIRNKSSCTLSMIIFVHFKYFGIVRYTQTFVIFTVMCKGHNISSICDHYTIYDLSLVMRKPLLCHMGTTKVQIKLCSLTSTIILCCVDSIIPILAKAKISRH